MSDDDIRAAMGRVTQNLYADGGYIGLSKLSDLFTEAGTTAFDKAVCDARILAAAVESLMAERDARARDFSPEEAQELRSVLRCNQTGRACVTSARELVSLWERALSERDQLAAWKQDATAVMPDYQELGKLLEVPLGESVHDKIVPGIRRLVAQVAELEASARKPVKRHGIFVSSRASVPERPAMWRLHRDLGHPIISTWIDEAVPGQSDMAELWPRIIREVQSAELLILYVELGDLPLKGALVEIGAAIAAGIPVRVVAYGVPDSALGSWMSHPLVTRHGTVLGALANRTSAE